MTTPKEFSTWNSFNSNISHFKQRRTAASRAINEVHSYLEDDVIPRNKNPLNWWRTNKLKYPKIYKIASSQKLYKYLMSDERV